MSATAGRRAKHAGGDAEAQVAAVHARYARDGGPLLAKQATGVRVTGRTKGGAVVGHWHASAPVDYLGAMPCGRAVALEVKSAATPGTWRLMSRGECVIRDAQWRALDAYAARGAVVAVLLRLAGWWWWCPWGIVAPLILAAIDEGRASLSGAQLLAAGATRLGTTPDWRAACG